MASLAPSASLALPATDVLALPTISRLVNIKGAQKLLRRFRLPKYVSNKDIYLSSGMVDILASYRVRAKIYCWWRKYLDGDPPRYTYPFDLQVAFIHEVGRLLFPIDGAEMDGLFNSGAFEENEPIDFPIQYLSYGIPWEMEEIDTFEKHIQPLIGIAMPLLTAQCEEFQIDAADAKQHAWQWWEYNYGPVPYYKYIEYDFQLADLRSALACQEPPLDGMAVALDCVTKRSGNVFIDAPTWFRSEYNPHAGGRWYDEYFWDDKDIEILTAEYTRAKPDIERLEAYEKWFEQTPDAMNQVTRLLVDLVDREWYIENGKVVFNDRTNNAGTAVDD